MRGSQLCGDPGAWMALRGWPGRLRWWAGWRWPSPLLLARRRLRGPTSVRPRAPRNAGPAPGAWGATAKRSELPMLPALAARSRPRADQHRAEHQENHKLRIRHSRILTMRRGRGASCICPGSVPGQRFHLRPPHVYGSLRPRRESAARVTPGGRPAWSRSGRLSRHVRPPPRPRDARCPRPCLSYRPPVCLSPRQTAHAPVSRAARCRSGPAPASARPTAPRATVDSP